MATTAEQVGAKGGRCLVHKLDVRSTEQWTAAAQAIIAELGQVDALVNNAGVMCRPEFQRIERNL